jgi:hypothetical protein
VRRLRWSTDQTRIDVTALRGRHGAPGIRLHRSRSLDAQDTTTHEGIPITTIARTLLDLAATARADRLERAVAEAMYLRVYDHRAITDVIARSNGHRGTAILTRATAIEPRRTRGDWEARMLRLVRAASLPVPLCNEPFYAPTTASASPTSVGPHSV